MPSPDPLTRRETLTALGAAALAGCADDPAGAPTSTPTDPPTCETDAVHDGYETVDVTVRSVDGDARGSVTAAVVDTDETRALGLSDTACLPEDRGMWFVYGEEAERSFWMNEMAFGIDIVYVDGDGRITSIHHADAPESDETGRESHHSYAGRGQYVLETAYEWTTRHGVEVGDGVEWDAR